MSKVDFLAFGVEFLNDLSLSEMSISDISWPTQRNNPFPQQSGLRKGNGFKFCPATRRYPTKIFEECFMLILILSSLIRMQSFMTFFFS